MHIEGKFLTLMDVHKLIKAMKAIELLNPEVQQSFIDYVVECGYDHEEYVSILGLTKAVNFLHRLVLVNPKFNNPNFLVHMEEFIKENFNDFKPN
jgi:hypothetical protein